MIRPLKRAIVLFLIFSLLMLNASGCQKITRDLANAPAPEDAPEYTVEP